MSVFRYDGSIKCMPVVWIVLLSVLVFTASAVAEPVPAGNAQKQERRTLTIRTSDGLIVIESIEADLITITEKLGATPDRPGTNKQLFSWLVDNGAKASSIRIYIEASAQSEKSAGLPPVGWTDTSVAEAEASGIIPAVSGKTLYEAYMLLRTAGFEFYLMEGAVGKSPFSDMLNHTVFVLSSGAWNGYFGIYVDGVKYSKNSSGYHIVSFSPGGNGVESSRGFNMFVDPEAGYKMAEFLNNLPPGTFIAAAVNIGPGVFFPQAAADALHSFGSLTEPDPEILSSHAMIGRKGLEPGGAFEEEDINLGVGVVVFDSALYVNPNEVETLFTNKSGRAAVLSGTGPDDRIMVYSPSF